MNRRRKQGICRLCAMSLLAAVGAYAQQMPDDYDQTTKTLGKQGDFKDGVLKVNIPRSDLKVTIDGIATPTPFGFGGWLARTKVGDGNGPNTLPGLFGYSPLYPLPFTDRRTRDEEYTLAVDVRKKRIDEAPKRPRHS